MTMSRLTTGMLVAVLLGLAAGSTYAQPMAGDPESLQAAIEQAKARLKLTPEQEAQMKPLMEERAAKLKAIRDSHAGDDSRRAKRDMYRESRVLADDYQAKVREILTDEQEAEWEKMRAEARERLKERYREGRAAD